MKNKRFYIIMLIAVVILLGGCSETKGFEDPSVSGGIANSDESLSSTEVELGDDKDINSSSESTESSSSESIVKDKNKSIVYDLIYEPMENLDSYESVEGKTFYFADTVNLPYINVNTPDVQAFNKEIELMADILITDYKTAKEQKVPFYRGFYYSFTINGDIVSVVLVEGHHPLENGQFMYEHYSSFNFDKSTGKRVENEQLLKKFGVEKDIAKLISNRYKNIYKNSNEADEGVSKELLARSLNCSWNDLYNLPPLKDSIMDFKYLPLLEGYADNRLFLSLDESGNLRFAIDGFTSGGSQIFGGMESVLPIAGDKDFDSVGSPINPMYEYVAQKMNVDTASTGAPFAFVGYLGSREDGKAVENNLADFAEDYKLDIDELAVITTPVYQNLPSELYIVVPRYREATSAAYSIVEGADSNTNETGFVESYNGMSTMGSYIICCNSRTRPDSAIRLQYLDKYLRIEFGVNSETSEILPTPEIMDMQKLFIDYKLRSYFPENIDEVKEAIKPLIDKALSDSPPGNSSY